MPSIRAAAAAACLALTLTACSSLSPPAAPAPAATSPARAQALLLISIDAFRADYLQRGVTPNLERLAREGVRAAWMNPSYPSLTFPNHYTLVTGLRPDHHGIVHNLMWDDGLGRFKLSDRDSVANSRWWGGEPIWVGAEKAGLRTATMFWPGSEAEVQNTRPTRWLPFDETVSAEQRVDTVLKWLRDDASTRPRLVTLYFDQLDHAGHDFGPDSPQVRTTLATLDRAIGRLVDGLSERDQLRSVDIVIVSDHGMASVPAGHFMRTTDIIAPEDADVVSDGQSIGITPKPGRTAAVEAKLLGGHPQYDCWRKGELPERWRYGSNLRVPPIVCQMHEGWDALFPEKAAKRPPQADRGSHGFDPALPSMRAIFIAHGPSFRDGVQLPAFDNVDVYPMLARLLGIAPARNDGDIAPLLPALKD